MKTPGIAIKAPDFEYVKISEKREKYLKISEK